MNSTYIIAEIGNTHEGSLGLAKQFMKAAKECGVDAVKFQTHIFEAESLPSAPNPPYFKDETRKEYFERTAFSLHQWIELKAYANKELGLDFMSSPFSLEAVDLLESIEMEAFKIPSGEVNNLPLLEKVGRTGKKVLLSSGMSSWEEIDEAVKALKDNGCKDLVLLQCTSEYPCPADQSGLNVIQEMRSRYEQDGLKVGYSDHTMGIAIPIGAVVLGATVIEKHFTLSNKMYGSDAKNSIEPEEFKRLVDEIRDLDLALGSTVNKNEKVKELTHMKMTFEKSIVSVQPIKRGETITMDKLGFKKPGDGIQAKYYKDVLGKQAKVDINLNEQITLEMLR